jgi:DNA (cytosine-5)-methyltransferase 1
MNYYNEHDNGAADWLESLIERQLIPSGTVDRRSIEDVLPDDLQGYNQCHFFAGIGGWSRALEIAGHATTPGIWTGSCPCQPFSSAGKRAGTADERHLWPAFHWLIKQCRPERVFGEQVAGKAGVAWFDIVQSDLASEGYTSGCAVLAAGSVGAPHQRKRLYWVAHSDGERKQANSGSAFSNEVENGPQQNSDYRVKYNGPDLRSSTGGPWSSTEYIQCSDGKARPFKPGVLPLADGLPGRLGIIKGYGNAIVPQCGAAFISAAIDLARG